MNKRFLALLAALILCLGLVACGSDEKNEAEKSATKEWSTRKTGQRVWRSAAIVQRLVRRSGSSLR